MYTIKKLIANSRYFKDFILEWVHSSPEFNYRVSLKNNWNFCLNMRSSFVTSLCNMFLRILKSLALWTLGQHWIYILFYTFIYVAWLWIFVFVFILPFSLDSSISIVTRLYVQLFLTCLKPYVLATIFLLRRQLKYSL